MVGTGRLGKGFLKGLTFELQHNFEKQRKKTILSWGRVCGNMREELQVAQVTAPRVFAASPKEVRGKDQFIDDKEGSQGDKTIGLDIGR